jgi:hypothetical protein
MYQIKIYQTATKFTKPPQNLPICRKKCLIAIKYTNIFDYVPTRTFKMYPKWDFWFENTPSGNPDLHLQNRRRLLRVHHLLLSGLGLAGIRAFQAVVHGGDGEAQDKQEDESVAEAGEVNEIWNIFTDIRNILRLFGTLCVHLVHFFRFWYYVPRKIWQPWIPGSGSMR